MTRRVRLTILLGCAALTLTIAAVSLVTLLTHGVAPALAATGVAADTTSTPAGSPTPAAVATISAGSAGSIAPAAPTLTSATIAVGLTCVTAVIGLIIAVVTLSALLRGGYGPFLRAMMFGSKVKGAARSAKSGQFAQSDWNDGGSWDASHTLNYRPSHDARDDTYGSYSSYPYHPYDERERTRSDRSRRRAPTRSRRGGWD